MTRLLPTIEIPFHQQFVHWIGRAHLIYLGLLPALATFVSIRAYGSSHPFLLFLGGTAVVGVYLAATHSYTRPPVSLKLGLFILLDGPILAALASSGDGGVPFDFAIQGFLIDGSAIWAAIGLLALYSGRPTRGQQIASLALVVIALGTLSALFWPYLRDHLWGQWGQLFWLVVGIVEAIFVQHRLLDADVVVGDSEDSILYIVGLVFAWVGALFAGMIMHETGG